MSDEQLSHVLDYFKTRDRVHRFEELRLIADGYGFTLHHTDKTKKHPDCNTTPVVTDSLEKIEEFMNGYEFGESYGYNRGLKAGTDRAEHIRQADIKRKTEAAQKTDVSI